MNVGAFQEHGPWLKWGAWTGNSSGSLPGSWLCDLWFPGSFSLLRRGPWSLRNISVAQVRRRDELAVSPNSAVTFNEGSKPGYSVPVREHSRACTHILPINEALLRNSVLTPILFLSALPVTPRRKVVIKLSVSQRKRDALLKWHSLGTIFPVWPFLGSWTWLWSCGACVSIRLCVVWSQEFLVSRAFGHWLDDSLRKISLCEENC